MVATLQYNKIGMQHPAGGGWRLRLEWQQRQRPKTNVELNVRILFAALKPGERERDRGGELGDNAGWLCVCTVPAKCMSMRISGSEICKHAAKMHFVPSMYTCRYESDAEKNRKGKSHAAWLGFTLPDLPNVMTMPAARRLVTPHRTRQKQTVTVQCVCPCRFSVFDFVIHLSQIL